MRSDNAQARAGSPRVQADFFSLADSLSSFIALVEDGALVYVNPAGCALLGRARAELVGRPLAELVPATKGFGGPGADAWCRGGSCPQRRTEPLCHADGRTIWLDLALDQIELDGRATTLVTGNDVTGRRLVEEQLARSEARLAEAQRIGHIGSWEIDLSVGRVAWSAELCRIFGASPDDFGGTVEGYLDFVHPDDRALARAVIDDALRKGGPFSFEHRVVHRNGDVRTIVGRGEVFTDGAGTPLRIAGTGQDLTDVRRMETELRRSEERFRNICTQAPVMLMSFDPQGRIRDVSNYWLQVMGYERGEVLGREGWQFISPASAARLRHAIEENQRHDESVIRNLPLQGIRKDGTTVDLLSTSVAEISDSGEATGAICVQINLTDLQRAEAVLRESEERYRALVEHAPEAIVVLDADTGLFVDANARAEELFGHPRERLLTMGPLDFCTEEQEDGRPSCEVIEEENRRVLEGETPVFEFTHVGAAGREIYCQTRLSRLPAAGRRLIRMSTTDITELKQLQEKVRHADRLAAAGALAAGVAHEIGNPLMALSMAAESLERRTCDEYSQKKLALIREHCERISRIVRQMSELARPQSGRREVCDLNEVVRRAVDMVRYDERARGAAIVYELAAGLPPVLAVEDELSQVCINLALNAFDAMAANPPERPRVLTIGSTAADGHVAVAFRDSGPGVPPAARGRIFEPFFTTKEAGRGSGLGLSVSYRILEEHGGVLRHDADAEGGAFVFELPRADRA